MLTSTHAWNMDYEPAAEFGTGRQPRFRLLGNLEVWSADRQTEIRGTIQRTLLATLLAAGSRTVSVQSLVDELWAENPPATAENSLQAHVSRLRRKLHSVGDRQPLGLLSLPSGYRLLVTDVDVDALLFMQTVQEARRRAAVDPHAAVDRIRQALGAWRGPVFGGPMGGSICQAAAASLEAARTVALETLFDLELHHGRHSEVISELSALVESPSLNERICEQLMVALYRSGRQTEALSAFRRMRVRLDDELGVSPSPSLRKLETAILNHDPALHYGGDHLSLRS
ncbi:AfsR/SARP family transcriptional regulator [Jatrophihabitans lederbergiae]|uniref:AfsR/SARP family transcriptional regulator n=1 Tax=Jatrophihabitans lederbergiae TaxID=3075547 RepID=A0ABU2JBU4_9ACTN|nr:AfsR/SARP family transcriptional regulator [Jatrophihabitans sp. DSM 44399]MDT0262134.1 AfsR/SARP family transcriptional regulator [Jatrophihabitans sp. DSM 44399]